MATFETTHTPMLADLPTFAPRQITFDAPAKAYRLPDSLPTLAPAQGLPTLSYKDALDFYDEDRRTNPQLSGLTLPEWATLKNQETGSQMFDQATTTGIGRYVKRVNAGLNSLIESSGLPNALHRIGSSVVADMYAPTTDAQVQQATQAGEMVGSSLEGFPRAVANLAPVVVGGLLAPETGGLSLAGVLGTAGTAGLSAADTYQQTGSKGQAALTAATMALMPTVAGKGGQTALKLAGSTLENAGGQLVGETLGQRLAQVAGSQLAAGGLMEFSHQAGSVASGQGFDTDPKHFLESAISQLPFLAFDLPTLVKGGQLAAAIRSKNETARLENESSLQASMTNERNAEARSIREDWEKSVAQSPFGSRLPNLEAVPELPTQEGSTLFSPKYTDDGYGAQVAADLSGIGSNIIKIGDSVVSGDVSGVVVAKHNNGSLVIKDQKTGQNLQVAPNSAVKGGVGSDAWSSEVANRAEAATKQQQSFEQGQTQSSAQLPGAENLAPSGVAAGAPEFQKEGVFKPVYKAETLLGTKVETEATKAKSPESATPSMTNLDEYIRLKAKQEEVAARKGAKSAEPSTPTPTVSSPAAAAAAFDASKVTPTPISTNVVEQIVKPALAEKDVVRAITGVKTVYEKFLKPEFGVHDVVLDELNDESLRKTIQSHVEEGATLDEAVRKTTQGVRNALAKAVETKQKSAISDAAAAVIARIKAKQTGSTLAGIPDLSIYGDYVELGYHLAKSLLVAGKFKIAEWRDQILQAVGVDPGFSDAEWNKILYTVRHRINASDEGPAGVVQTRQRERMGTSMESLNKLDEAFNSLPPESRGKQKSPLEKVSMWRNDILERRQNYNKYPEVDEAMLKAAGTFQHNGQTWTDSSGKPFTDQQAKSLLNRTAQNAYKAATKSEQGGQEIVSKDFVDLNAANIEADLRNRGLGDSADHHYEGGLINRGKSNEQAVLYKTYKRFKSLDEGFRPERESLHKDETDQVIHDEDAVPTGDENDPRGERATSLEEAPLGTLEEEGEVIDPTADANAISDRVAADSDETSGHIVRQHFTDVFDEVLKRLDPMDATVQKISERDTMSKVARTRIAIDYFRDSRQPLSGKDMNWQRFIDYANSHLHPDFQFSDQKVAANWWNNTGKGFWHDWAIRQPEFTAMHEAAKVKPVKTAEGTFEGRENPFSPSYKRAVRRGLTEAGVKILPGESEPTPHALGIDPVAEPTTEPDLSAVGEARITLTDFTRRFFERRGEGPEGAQRSADAIQRIGRAVTFFKSSENAKLSIGQMEPGAAGVAVANTVGEWAPIVRLNQNLLGDNIITVVAGHESFEVLLHSINRGEGDSQSARAVQSMLDRAETMSADDRMELLRQAVTNLPDSITTGMDKNLLDGLLQYSAADSKETVSTLAGLHVLAASDPSGLPNFKSQLLYGDGYVSRMLSAIVNTAKSLVKAFRGVNSSIKEGFISDVSKPFADDLAHFDKLFESVRNTDREIQSAVSQLTTLDALTPENFWDAVRNGYAPEISRTGDADIDGAIVTAYARTLPEGDPNDIGKFKGWAMDFIQLAESHPALKPILGEMLDWTSRANDAARNAFSPFFTRDFVRGTSIIGEPLKALQRLAASDKMRTAFTDQVLSEGPLGRVLSESELAELHLKHNLDTNERQDLSKVRQAMSDAHRIVGQQIVRSTRDQIMHSVSRLIMAGTDTPYKNAIQAADRIVNVATSVIGQSKLPAGIDPMALITSIPQEFGVNMDKIILASETAKEMMPGFQALVKAVTDRPEFISEQRFGRYSVSFTEQGKKLPGRISAESKSELRTKLEEYQKTHTLTSEPTWYDNSDQNFAGLRPDMVAGLKSIGDAAYSRTAATLGQEAADGARAAFTSFDQAVEKELNARGIKKYVQPRKYAPGRETLDMIENSLKYLSTVPRALEKGWLRDRASVALLDPQMVQNPRAAQLAKQQVQNVLATESGWARKAKEWTFTYFLGANPSSAIVEQVQPLLAVPAQLIHDGAGLGKAYEYVGKAYKMTAEGYLKDKISDPFVADMIHQLDRGGVLEQQTIGNIIDHVDDVGSLNLSRMVNGDLNFKNASELGKQATSYVGSVMRTMYAKATGVSSRVTAVAASLHAQDLIASGKLKPEEAYDYVRRVLTLTAPGTGGRVSRPIGPYSNEGTRSAVGVVLSLTGYTNTMWSMMGRLAHDAVKTKSLTSAESKAFMTMAGTQLLAAGVLGLPAVGTTIAILNNYFPEWNLKANIRTNMAKMLGEDEANGGMFSDILLRGAASTLTGVDASSRLSLSNMLGVSDYDGFQMAHMLGAPGAVLSNLFQGLHSAAQGQFGEALEKAAPNSVKNVLRVFRDQGDVRDPEGRLSYGPSAGEQVAMLAGFTPQKVAQMREFNSLAKQQEQTARNEQSKFISQTAQLLSSGDMAGVRAALVERERANPDEFNAAEGLKLVIQRMQDQTFPEDPRRGGSKMNMTDRADLLNSYGPSAIGPSEQQRLQQQQQITQKFGLVGGIDQTDIMKAGMVDLFMQKNPAMTRQQARDAVDKLTRKKPKQSLPGMRQF